MKAKWVVLKISQGLVAFVLWLAFTFGCVMAPIFAILLLIPSVRRIDYFNNFEKAADRMAAAECGYSGRFMLSTEAAHAPCLKKLHDVLNWLDDGHCESSAFSEGAYCRISDHKLGYK